jgi:pilus assembly protein CpaB
VARGTPLTEKVVGVAPWQKDAKLSTMFTTTSEVIGKVARFDLEPGVPIVRGMLVMDGEQLSGPGSTSALAIPKGMVAVSVPISRLSSVSFAPQSGDHVNVMVSLLFVDLDTDFQSVLPNRSANVVGTGSGESELAGNSQTGQTGKGAETGGVGGKFKTNTLVGVVAAPSGPQGKAEVDPVFGQTFYFVPNEPQRPRMVTQAILQDVIVLHVGNFIGSTPVAAAPAAQPTPAPDGQQPQQPPAAAGGRTVTPQFPDVITLVVAPQDAVTLNYLVNLGATLNLALRAAGDDSRVQTEAVTLRFLLDQYRIPVPVKLPYTTNPRVDVIVPPALTNDVKPTPQP